MATNGQAVQDNPGGNIGSGLNIIAGAWLFISAFWIPGGPSAFWNNIIVGAIVFILACVRYFGSQASAGVSWINLILGLWTIITPWVLNFPRTGGTTANQVIVGIIIALLGIWAAQSTPTGYGGARRMTRAGV